MVSARFSRHRTLAAIAALVLTAPAGAAAPGPHLPPPGLYRVATLDGGTVHSDGAGAKATVDVREDRPNGRVDYKAKGFDGKVMTRRFEGQAAQDFCIPAGSKGLALPNMGNCSATPGKPGKDGITMTMRCPGLESTVVVRQVDAKTWEYRTHVVQSSPVGGMDLGIARMKAMMQHQAKNGATAQERAEAADALRSFDAEMAELKQASAQAAAPVAGLPPQAGAPGAPGLEARAVVRLIRIGDQCASGKKG